MNDRQRQLCARFESAGLGVVLALVLVISGSCWLQWPDRAKFVQSSTSSTRAGTVLTIGGRQNSFVDHWRRLETIIQPRLALLLLVAIALACAGPVLTHALSAGTVGRVVCKFGQLLGVVIAVAGVAAAIDVARQDHSLQTSARPLHCLCAAALATSSVLLARIGPDPDGSIGRRPARRTKRPTPRPLNVARDKPVQP